jgi:hypothetical protein
VGGGCTLYPDIETAHVFARIEERKRFEKGVRSGEWIWWNALFILETMIMDVGLRDRLRNFVHPELTFNMAKQMIKRNSETVSRIREANRAKFKNTPDIFVEKFDYRFKV